MSSLKKLNKHQMWLLKQFIVMHKVAYTIYTSMHHGSEQNLYKAYREYENGVFGWVKESNCFFVGVVIYDDLKANDGFDIINDLEDSLGEEYTSEMSYQDIVKWEEELQEIE